jgi:hypothetical protein
MAFGNMSKLPEVADLPTLVPSKIKARELCNGDHVLDEAPPRPVELKVAYNVGLRERGALVTGPDGEGQWIPRIAGLVTGVSGFSLDPDEDVIVYRPKEDS